MGRCGSRSATPFASRSRGSARWRNTIVEEPEGFVVADSEEESGWGS
jgi:hypothetical protein